MLVLTGALMVGLALAALGVELWFPPTRSSDPTSVPSATGPSGEIEGRVKRLEANTNTLYVSSGSFGLRATALAVGPETEIFVSDKVGGFGDLREGVRVRICYEVRSDVLLARAIEVPARSGGVKCEPAPLGVAPAPPRVAPSVAVPTEPPASARGGVTPAALPERRSPTAIQPVGPRPPVPPIASPEPRRAPMADPPQSIRAVDPAPPVSVAGPVEPQPATPQTPPRPRTTSPVEDSADATAVIDWLLKPSSPGDR